MKTVYCVLLGVMSQLFVLPSKAETYYLGGTVTNITSTRYGLMIMLNGGQLPGTCAGTPYNWMLIEEQESAMISVVLSHYLAGKRNATVYVDAYTGSGFCKVSQYDPGD